MLVKFFIIKVWCFLKFYLKIFYTKILFYINVALFIFTYRINWCRKYSLIKFITLDRKAYLSWWLLIEIDKIFL